MKKKKQKKKKRNKMHYVIKYLHNSLAFNINLNKSPICSGLNSCQTHRYTQQCNNIHLNENESNNWMLEALIIIIRNSRFAICNYSSQFVLMLCCCGGGWCCCYYCFCLTGCYCVDAIRYYNFLHSSLHFYRSFWYFCWYFIKLNWYIPTMHIFCIDCFLFFRSHTFCDPLIIVRMLFIYSCQW